MLKVRKQLEVVDELSALNTKTPTTRFLEDSVLALKHCCLGFWQAFSS